MKPKFADMQAWQQAELLMQPAFIRLIDNLRKQLETSSWKGTYRDVMVWADDTPDDVKTTVTQLKEQLETASPEEQATIQEILSKLPTPYPGYELRLENSDRHLTIDLWELCYKICFRTGEKELTDDRPVEVDTNLIDDTGEVDWNRLDDKTKEVVSEIFEHLPS
jgi:molybdopterin converting factor small subunit